MESLCTVTYLKLPPGIGSWSDHSWTSERKKKKNSTVLRQPAADGATAWWTSPRPLWKWQELNWSCCHSFGSNRNVLCGLPGLGSWVEQNWLWSSICSFLPWGNPPIPFSLPATIVDRWGNIPDSCQWSNPITYARQLSSHQRENIKRRV